MAIKTDRHFLFFLPAGLYKQGLSCVKGMWAIYKYPARGIDAIRRPP
ncbi:MAG: hypothetical protein K0R51_2981 [Cytophagaceae bacterium]|jgi:hypothetical protein|nr:hypothetical protein [Cytophagaceae bacterium]